MVSLATKNDSVAMGNSMSVLNEIEMAQRLARTSRHIVNMYDFDFHHTGLSFQVMELGQEDLEDYLSKRTVLSPIERKVLWRQLVDIANTLHKYEIVIIIDHIFIETYFISLYRYILILNHKILLCFLVMQSNWLI